MDELEQRLATAMTARAELVTADSLRDLPAPRRTPRWPMLVAAAAAVLAVAGVVAASAWYRADPPATPTPPPSVVPTVVSPDPSHTDQNPGPPPVTRNSATTQLTVEPPPACGGQTCVRVGQAEVAGDVVELWAADDKSNWQLRVGQAVVPGRTDGARFASGLTCQVVAARPVCLVATHDLGDESGYVGVEKRDQWRLTGALFVAAYGATSIEARDIYENGYIEVVSEETLNDTGLWTSQVWRWDGSRLGCTPRVGAREELPATPDVPTLAIANCF